MAVSVLRNISKIRIVLTQRIPRISIIQQIYPAINKSFLTWRTMSSNRLTTEKSPYLLQHATNPVNWYPWGEEAIEASRSQNKLIFLSVGYSTCHWCHVMERESFENPEVADIMNKHYINVKVDREERPDVDRVYMSFVQASTGGGGWPMSVFLTPSLKPIFGGTYFPPEDLMYGRPGFKSILLNIAKQWESKRDELSESGDKIIEALSDAGKVASLEDNIMTQVDELSKICFLQFQRSYDEEMGGFSRAPKFPQPVNLNYLFNYHAIGKEDGFMKESLEMCLNTLENMARGGIHDHVSKGFARYSTDPAWHVPHFEKMLYDQGQLAVAYSRAFQITKDPKFSDVVTDIIDYVTRDLKHPQGGFYSGEDADSLPTHDSEKKQEGAFCVWTYDELGQLLTGKDLDIFSEYFTVRQDGNVSTRSDPHGELAGRNVLTNVGIDNEEIKSKFQLSDEELVVVIERCKAVLFEARGKRPRPHLDDKIITAWNGLMISGLCQAGSSLGKAEYIIQATKTATFIREHLFNESENELLRSIYNGGNGTLAQLASPIKGFLDDYAFLIRGLIDLYESGFDPKWLEWAMDLQEKQNSLFWDVESKAYFTTQEGDASIVMRLKEDQDGAEPSGNSVSCHNLIRLAALLDRADYREKAEQIFSAFGQTLLKFPVALPEMASALLIHQKTLVQICIAGDSVSANELIEAANSIHLPNKVIIRVDGNQESILYKKLKILHDMPASETKAYVCHNFTCSAPVTSKADLIKLLKSL